MGNAQQQNNGRRGQEKTLDRGSDLSPRGFRGRRNSGRNSPSRPASTPSPSNPVGKTRGNDLRPRRGFKRYILTLVILVVALFIVWMGVFTSRVDTNMHSFPSTEQAELDSILAPSANWGTQRVNVLLLGSDVRPDDPGLGARTDAIILARIDPATKDISLVSLPRDTMVDIPEQGPQKLNAAYAFGGPDGVVDAVEKLCGVEIDHCAVVDFIGLSNLVDAIGGIDVVVDSEINNPDAGEAIVPAGEQHINGAQALVMSRDRDYIDGDYSRQSNQRKVLSAILHRILSLPPWEMLPAVEGCSECVATDSSTGSAGLLLLAARLKAPGGEMQLNTTVLPSQPADIGGISYVIADTAGTAELMERFKDGRDITEPVTTTSIDQDIAAAQGW